MEGKHASWAVGLALAWIGGGSAWAQHPLQELPGVQKPNTPLGVELEVLPASVLVPAPQPTVRPDAYPSALTPPDANVFPPAMAVGSLDGANGTCETAPAPGNAVGGVCARAKYRLQACWLGFPEEWIARPLGESVYLNANTQVANAQAARMVLYQYDFCENSDQLNPRGLQELGRIAALLRTSPLPVVIERGRNGPALNEARRLAVLNELGRWTLSVPVERVVVGDPIALGLRGVEAEIIYQNLLLQTQSGGTRAGASPGSIGGTVGLGFNAPGR